MALHILQVLFALLVVVLVVWKMIRVDRQQALKFHTRCLLDGTGQSGRLRGVEFCIYAVSVGIISLIATAVLRCANGCLGCLTFNACGIANFGSMLIATVMFAWWIIAFALFLDRGIPANEKAIGDVGARNVIIASSFGAAASFFLEVVFTCCGMSAGSR